MPRLLASIDAAIVQYSSGPAAVEVIVADNGSTDDTAAIARGAGARVVKVQPRVIASVRNGGAAAARGEWLAFVDADMQLHPETFNAINAALSDRRIAGGASGIRHPAGTVVGGRRLRICAYRPSWPGDRPGGGAGVPSAQ